MSQFTHLHVHSHYSILDGMSTISGLIDKAVRTGMSAIALTDHGNMYGIKEFFDYGEKINAKVHTKIAQLKQQLNEQLSEAEQISLADQIRQAEASIFKTILGCEVYVARRTRFDKSLKEDGSGYHLILLAKNKQGYQNLCKLVSMGWTQGYYYRPRIDKEILEQYREGLIVTSACLGGEIHRKLEAGDYNAAKEAARWFKDRFEADYYIELQRHPSLIEEAKTTFERQQIQNKDLISIAEELDVKLVATNDVHFVEEDHAEAHDRLICLSTGKDLKEKNRMRYTQQEWLKTPEEMTTLFADIPEALYNTQEIVDKIAYYSLNRDPIMPTFNIPPDFGTEQMYKERYSPEDLIAEFEPDNESKGRIEKLGGLDKAYRIKLESDYLRSLTMEQAKIRYGDNLTDEVKERIDFELDVMRNMGFPGYFLIVHDLIREARLMGVSVGPGRGSAAGSVVSYCLGITDIDPLKYDLLFERFLNPDRISLPDIDIDFDDEGRNKVLNWITEKYGKERVAHIVTYGTMAAKSSVKDVARVQNLPLATSNNLAKLIPNAFPKDNKTGEAPPVTIANCLKMVNEFKEASRSKDENVVTTIKYASMLEGTVRQTGVHACGVIIGADDLTDFVPIATAKDKETGEDMPVTQYEGSSIESVGLIKMDILGLKTLTIIKDALRNIKKSKGTDIDINALNMDDELTYQLFSDGATVATFQFESEGMQKYLRDLKPSKLEDLIAMNALYRPGPMKYIPQFIRRKHGLEPIEYPFPEMEKRLKETHGITVYQEQVMLLSRDLAGFTRGQSDELRKAMGKKQVDKMKALHTKFIEGATQRGFEPVETLEQIWSDWEQFASYAFNKSHATCYSWVAYQTAYLKAHYPAEFMAANLTNNLNNVDEISKLIADCQRIGIAVLGPDINESDAHFTVNAKGEIRFGLGAIKGVGHTTVEDIIKERETNGVFTSIFDFIQRINLRTCNKRAIEALALAGSFDTLGDTHRAQFFVETDNTTFLEKLLKYASAYQGTKIAGQISLFDDDADDNQDFRLPIPFCQPWTPLQKLNKEREVTGFYISGHPLDDYRLEINNFCKYNLAELEKTGDMKRFVNNPIFLAGMV
ncbi:MAG: DNA polymerase III subunit alpha, partial [Bacteroidales bacterium]|nr:DNA polymerase III subunit alpha [Bacteroidales bacterium]